MQILSGEVNGPRAKETALMSFSWWCPELLCVLKGSRCKSLMGLFPSPGVRGQLLSLATQAGPRHGAN